MQLKIVKKINTQLKKILLVICLSFTLSFSPIAAPKSHAWMAIPAAYVETMLEQIYDKIQGIILGMLKQQAVKMLTEQVEKAVAGVGGEAKFITDWKDYLIKDPEDTAKKYMNDYLSQMLGGRTSGAGYKPRSCQGAACFGGLSQSDLSSKTYAAEGFFGSHAIADSGGACQADNNCSDGARCVPCASVGAKCVGNMCVKSRTTSEEGGGNYYQTLFELAKASTTEKAMPKVTYEGDPKDMFKDGTFKNMNEYLSGINDPWTFVVAAQQEYEKKLAEEKKIAEDKAIAYYGFIGTGDEKGGDGKIKTPGSLIKENLANVQDLGNKVLAAATHPEEMITAFISQMITKAIDKGIGEIESQLEKGLEKAADKARENSSSQQTQSGPGTRYGRPSDTGSCTGKKDGETCTLNVPIGLATEGTCKAGLCQPTN